MARPKLEFKFDAESIEKMAQLNVPVEDMAFILGCHKDTIYARFPTEIAKGRASRKTQLRIAQDEAAFDKGNITMLIWLGKQDLDQSDKLDQKIDDVSKDKTLIIELQRDEYKADPEPRKDDKTPSET